MPRRKYTFEEILGMDNMLLKLALYEVAEGNMLTLTTQDEFLKIQKSTAKTFNYFKNLIRCGELSLEDLKEMVAHKHGAVEKNGMETINEANADAVIADIDSELADREKSGTFQKEIGELLGSIFANPYASSGLSANNPFAIVAKKTEENSGLLYNRKDEQPTKKTKAKRSFSKNKKNSKKNS